MARIFKKPERLPGRRRYLLLIGAPRSGTTLLAAMIGRHTDVGMLNEDIGRGFRKILSKPLSGNKLCVPNQIRMSRNQLLRWRWLKKLGVLREAPKSQFCIEDYLELPNLKIVAIIRDGQDSMGSMMVRGRNRLRKAARRWSEAIITIYKLRERYRNRVFVVVFDDLILQPEKSMRKLCEFLGLAFEEQMLEGHTFNSRYPNPGLDASKTHQARRQQSDLNLAALVPKAHALYQSLVAEARLDGGGAA
jgi:hypothetical protein